jgi:hypothetical protein
MAFQINGTNVIADTTAATIDNININVATRDVQAGTTAYGTSVYQGTISGYSHGGAGPTSPSPVGSIKIEKFSFPSNANATSVGSLTKGRYTSSGVGSTVSGYTMAGYTADMDGRASVNTTYEKFSFASDGNGVGVGRLTVGRWRPFGGSASSTYGYTGGGINPDLGPNSSTASNYEKFPFSSDENMALVNTLLWGATGLNMGATSSVSGYIIGDTPGAFPSGATGIIQKFPFATDSTTTLVTSSMVVPRRNYAQGNGVSSTNYGYVSGTSAPSQPATYGVSNQMKLIEKFAFASDGASTAVGQLTLARYGSSGQSSTINGYCSGGYGGTPVAAVSLVIDNWPFSSDSNATSVGQLVTGREEQAGSQARSPS